ncbi:NAD-dependent epimerase/dehydratase family protein [Sorangium sp. So ce887]|uniref:NAD-dependent epimerase/dehydratase family protein n=1 Tax=Sorangium sp. So ce887 TaxID=3133324 RepID=UPI003F5D69C5
MRVLVTGSTGMIGSHLVRALAAEGHAVRCLVRRHTERAEALGPAVEVVLGDLGDAGSLRRAVRGMEAVVHTAGVVSYWAPRRDELHRVNVLGTRALLDAAIEASVRRFLFTSSIATLGFVTSAAPGDEETPYNWQSAGIGYFDTKAQAEAMVRTEPRIEGLSVNPGITFGERDVHKNASRMLLQVARGGPLGCPPGATTVATIEDVVAGHLSALVRGRPGERYVLGGHLLTFQELYQRIATILGRPAKARVLSPSLLRWYGRLALIRGALTGKEPEFTPELAEISSRDRRYSSQRAEAELGYRVSPLEPCLARTWAWARARM